MCSLIFLLLKANGNWETHFDTPIELGLLGLDFIGLVLMLILIFEIKRWNRIKDM